MSSELARVAAHAEYASLFPELYNTHVPGPLPSAFEQLTSKGFRQSIQDSNVEYLPGFPKREGTLRALKFSGRATPPVYYRVAKKIAGTRRVPEPQLKVFLAQVNGVLDRSLGIDALSAKGFAAANRAFKAQQGSVTIKWSAQITVFDNENKRFTTRHASSELFADIVKDFTSKTPPVYPDGEVHGTESNMLFTRSTRTTRSTVSTRRMFSGSSPTSTYERWRRQRLTRLSRTGT
jgi:hypothetical protein